MTKHRFNTTFILLLITAFLAMQWATAHIHLAEQHDHGSSQHQHSIEAHAHQSIDHHADSIDSSHKMGEAKVVELDYEYVSPNGSKPEKHLVALSTPVFQPPLQRRSLKLVLPEIISTKLGHLHRSTVHPRAPPQLS